MKAQIQIDDVRLEDNGTSKGTIGSLDATITWTTDGINETIKNAGAPGRRPHQRRDHQSVRRHVRARRARSAASSSSQRSPTAVSRCRSSS